MEVPLANKQAMTNNRLKSFVHCLALIEIIGMLNQKALHQFRSIELHQRERPKMETSNVPTFTSNAQEKAETILLKCKHTANQWRFCNSWNSLCWFRGN